MSPVPPTFSPPMESKAGGAETVSPAGGAVPTNVDAYRYRGIRSKQSLLDTAPVVLRILTAVFTLIAFAVIASDSFTGFSIDVLGFVSSTTYHFNDFFFFSYLLTVNVIVFCYAIATIFVTFFLFSKSSVSSNAAIAIFALDQILSYLLMSASTSAATGLRIYNSIGGSFVGKASASVAFSFLAFFVLAAASLISGLRAVRRQ